MLFGRFAQIVEGASNKHDILHSTEYAKIYIQCKRWCLSGDLALVTATTLRRGVGIVNGRSGCLMVEA